AWGRARPALLAASVCMLLAGGTVAAIGVLTALSARRAALGLMPVSLHFPVTPPGHVPLSLILLDLLVQVSLAGVGVAVGWAVVRQGILIERRLPQRGFVSHWLGMAVAAAVLSLVVAVMATIEPLALPELLVLVALVAGAYALFTWQSYAAHERQLTQLRPFVASLTATRGAWLSTDPNEVEHSIESLFTSLCRDVLGAQHARLALSAGRLQRTFTYEASVDPAEQPPVESVDSREWVVPVSDEHGIFAKLVLGPRADGAGYTSSDLAVARACGDRILDAVGEFAAAQAIVSLARQRGLESELSAALPRRTLHDDVLPRLHLAMLRLDGLRGGLRSAESEPLAADLAAVVAELGRAHHDLAALMRSAPIVASRRLERGIVSALRASLDSEFRGTFDEVTWQVSEHGETAGNALSPVVADLLLGATLEAVRNAGKHARGGALHRTLRLHLRIDTQHDEAQGEELVIEVADDGVGLGSGREASAATPAADSAPGTRTGLLTHSALIALIGGNLSVRSGPDQGTTIILRVPVISHEYDAGDATSATPRPLIAGAS
ncbi:MAG TPA: ATP-binding protein, partial [Ktedonobacterales bacterium]